MYLVFDIGGTTMRLALSRDGRALEAQTNISTPLSFHEGIETLLRTAKTLTAGETLKGVSGGVPGTMNHEKTMTFRFKNLPDWENKPLKNELKKGLGCPVWLENDASLAGLAEAHRGKTQNTGIVAYLTIGTGVGGARIVDGMIDKNAMGFEPGHQILDWRNNQTLEDLIGGASLEKRYGKRPEQIQDSDVWNEAADILACGMYNITLHWSPTIVILGGSVMQSIPIDRVREKFGNFLRLFPQIPRIEHAAPGDAAGLYGALILLRQKMSLPI